MEEIDTIVDEQKYLAIINSSNWPTTKVINTSTKYQLMQHLLECEVYQKRQMAMACLAKGFQYFNLLPLIKRNVQAIIEHVKGATKPSVQKILSAITCEMTGNESREKAFGFFKSYIKAKDRK